MNRLDIDSVGSGGMGGLGGMGGGGFAWLLFGLLFGEGGFGNRRGKSDDCVTQTEFVNAVNNMQDSQRDQLAQITTQLAAMQNTNGQDKLSGQIETFKDLFVSLTQANSLSRVQEFNNISRQISDCCCATQASFAALNGKIDAQTCEISNKVETASAANLLALERAQNQNDKRFDELARGQQDIECLIKTTSLEQEVQRLRDANARYARREDLGALVNSGQSGINLFNSDAEFTNKDNITTR